MENPEVATLPEPAPLPVPPPAPAPPQEQPTPAVQVSPEDMALRSARDAWSANRTAATFQQVASLLDPTSLPPGDDVRMYMMKHFGHPNKSDLYGDDQSLSYTIEGNGTATIQFDTESPTKSWPRFDVK